MPVDTSKWNKMIWDQKLKSVEGLGLTRAAKKLGVKFYQVRYQRGLRAHTGFSKKIPKAPTGCTATEVMNPPLPDDPKTWIRLEYTSADELLVKAIVARPDLARRVALAYLQNGHAPK